MKIRTYEIVTVSTDGVPTIEGHTLSDWKKIMLKGIERNVRTGRNLHDWDHYESTPTFGHESRFKSVEGQPDHVVDPNYVYFHSYKHGGRVELQAVYFFEIEA